MTNPPPRGHQAVITGALDAWWLHSDPAKPLDHTDAARQVEEHLLHAGYYISPYAPNVPTRYDIASGLALTLACATAAACALIVGSLTWTTIGALGALLLGHQTADDIRDRHRGRRHLHARLRTRAR